MKRTKRIVLNNEIKDVKNINCRMFPSTRSPYQSSKISSFMKYQNQSSRSNFQNSSRENYSMFTPKSQISSCEGSNERTNLFKFKRELHKSKKSHHSTEITDSDIQKEFNNSSNYEVQNHEFMKNPKSDKILKFLLKENKYIKDELRYVKVENSFLKEQYSSLNCKLDHLAKAFTNFTNGSSPFTTKNFDINMNMNSCETTEVGKSANKSFDKCLKHRRAASNVCLGLIDESCADFSKVASSPKKINIVRSSHATPNIFTEKIDLNKKRYEYKMAKNNSMDKLGCLAQGYESTKGSKSRRMKPAIVTITSLGDNPSVTSERKARYYKPTLDSHKKIGIIKGSSDFDIKAQRVQMGPKSFDREIESKIPQMSKLFGPK